MMEVMEVMSMVMVTAMGALISSRNVTDVSAVVASHLSSNVSITQPMHTKT